VRRARVGRAARQRAPLCYNEGDYPDPSHVGFLLGSPDDCPGPPRRSLPLPLLIVLADDDDAIRDFLAEVLREEGYAVAEAGDGATALALVDATRPALLLTDNMMPHLTGCELIALLHARPGSALPILLLSAAPPGQVPYPACFLAKPFDLAHLLSLVATMLVPVAQVA